MLSYRYSTSVRIEPLRRDLVLKQEEFPARGQGTLIFQSTSSTYSSASVKQRRRTTHVGLPWRKTLTYLRSEPTEAAVVSAIATTCVVEKMPSSWWRRWNRWRRRWRSPRSLVIRNTSERATTKSDLYNIKSENAEPRSPQAPHNAGLREHQRSVFSCTYPPRSIQASSSPISLDSSAIAY